MRLKYLVPPLHEGGNAIAGCGTIHQSEIKPTLTDLSTKLCLAHNLNDFIIGSTGKRAYSGDIDIVIDKSVWDDTPGSFRNILNQLVGDQNTARHGNMVHLKFPITTYSDQLSCGYPRTGFVQIDFNFGDANWERFYHFSPGEDSEYKGAHRNLAIAAIAHVVAVPIDSKIDALGRPASITKWKFGANGFIHVLRVSVIDDFGHTVQKQQDINTGRILTDPTLIARELFADNKASASDLFSLETIMSAIKQYCGLVEQERIWCRMAENFHNWKLGRNFVYPPEINKYWPPDDK